MSTRLIAYAWYQLPDGTRVQAIALNREWRLLGENHAPLYKIVGTHIYRLLFDPETNRYASVRCDLQLDDLTPEVLLG